MSRAQLLSSLLWLAALVLAAWTLVQFPLGDISATLAALGWPQWLAWGTLNALVLLTFGWRWLVLNRALDLRVRFARLMTIRLAGQVVNFITPGPHLGGEPLQVFWLWRQCALPFPTALLSLGLDRFYELGINVAVLTGAALMVVAEPIVGMPPWSESLLVLGLTIAALAFGTWLLLGDTSRFSTGLARMTRNWSTHPRLRQAGDQWQGMRQDLQSALSRHKPLFAAALGISVLGWALLFAELALALRLAGAMPGIRDFVFIFVAMRLAMLLPMPGGIGTIEASLLWSFQLLQLPTSAALGLIALMRMRDAVVLSTGLACLYRMRVLQAHTMPAAQDRKVLR